jgi:hypothetical protein
LQDLFAAAVFATAFLTAVEVHLPNAFARFAFVVPT